MTSPRSLPEDVEAIAEAIVQKRDGIEVPDALVVEPIAAGKSSELSSPEESSLAVQVVRMNVAQRVKLALRGNRQARRILLRDANLAIRSMVLRNPRITEDEILEIAKSPQTDEHLLRELAENRDWISIYSVRAALVENPRTPFAEAHRLIATLNHRTLHALSKSKNVPAAVAHQAEKLLSHKERVGGSVGVRGFFSSSFDDREDDRRRPGKPPPRRRPTEL